jgi:Trehalose synthase, N-terminal domain
MFCRGEQGSSNHAPTGRTKMIHCPRSEGDGLLNNQRAKPQTSRSRASAPSGTPTSFAPHHCRLAFAFAESSPYQRVGPAAAKLRRLVRRDPLPVCKERRRTSQERAHRYGVFVGRTHYGTPYELWFFALTKNIHNGLQGDPIEISREAMRLHRDTAHANAATAALERYDILLVHDPQPIPLIELKPGATLDLVLPYRPVGPRSGRVELSRSQRGTLRRRFSPSRNMPSRSACRSASSNRQLTRSRSSTRRSGAQKPLSTSSGITFRVT